MSETQQAEGQVPSKEEIIKFLTEQIEVKKTQYELQELNTKLAVARAEELKALQFIAQMTNPQDEQPTKPHIVTQEDIDNNPQLQEAGVEVGDQILIPDYDEQQPKAATKKLKKETSK